MNYGAHVKFVNKWLERLEEEERQANAPPPREPGLITEPGLATDEGEREPQPPRHARSSSHTYETAATTTSPAPAPVPSEPIKDVPLEENAAQHESVSAIPAISG